MPSTTLIEELRSAVSAGRYGDADQLLIEYGISIDREWRAASGERRRDLAREASSLLDWVKHTILAGRAHAQLRQVQMVAARSYAAIDA